MAGRFLVVVAFLIERDGRLLMLRRSPSKDHAPGEWEPGSGRVESGETPVAAVHREAREETGLEVEILDVVDTFHYYRGAAREEAIGIVFHCRPAGGVFRSAVPPRTLPIRLQCHRGHTRRPSRSVCSRRRSLPAATASAIVVNVPDDSSTVWLL